MIKLSHRNKAIIDSSKEETIIIKTHRRLIYPENYGCTANKFDLEIMLAHLIKAGYQIVNEPEKADILLINTCGVKTPTEDKILHRIKKLSQLNKPFIITGCLPKIDLPAIRRVAPPHTIILDPYSINKILKAVECIDKGELNKIFFSNKPIIKLLEPKIRLNRFVEIVQIAEGCAGACSFCCVKFARGRLFSYPADLIVEKVKRAVSEGVREIWLTSQDNGAYGLDIGSDLAELLQKICIVNGRFMIRVGMMNPAHVDRMLDRLIDAYKNNKIFKFLHLPLQSGDDNVLRKMNRHYSVDDFKRIVDSFRRSIPEITLMTDVICGFPTESAEAFQRTLDLIEEIEPDIVNISKFFPRPGTPAERMGRIPTREVKERSRRLTELVRRISLKRNMSWIGWEGWVIIDEKGRGDSWMGRNYAYKPIVIRDQRKLLGRFVYVRVVEAHENYLEAKIIKE